MKLSVYKKIMIAVLALVPLIVTAALYRSMPDSIPIHWNSDGTVNYGDKWNIFIIASLNLIFAVTIPLLPKIDPRKKNYLKFHKYYDLFLLGLMLFGVVMWGVTLSETFVPGRISVGKVSTIAVSVLFIFMGNMMPKFKNNYFMGIKNPWTLSNDDVWNKTHRLAGFLYVIMGGVTLGCSFLLAEQTVFWILMGAVIFATLIPTVMSYLWYRKLSAE